MQTVSVVIPTRNAARFLPEHLAMLHNQTVPIAEIVIADTESEDCTREIAMADPLCRFLPIHQKDYDHGGTRDFVARLCTSDFVWFLTQDAIPVDSRCLEELLGAVREEDIACAYGRQRAPENGDRIEQLNHMNNYPEQSFVRSSKDIPALQIRAFFISNTYCLYKRETYLSCGGFHHFLQTNEDMLMVANFLKHGYRIAYCASACVWHTHHSTLKQWYRRSFDTGAFLAMFQ